MNYKETCWFCGKDTMEPVSTWYRCTSCGATWTEQPALGEYMGIVLEKRGTGRGRKYKPKVMPGRVKGGPALKPLLRPSDKGYGKANR